MAIKTYRPRTTLPSDIQAFDVAIYSEELATGTDAGTFTSGAWRTRAINTEVYDPSSIGSLSSNQITLITGTYLCEISCPALQVNHHQCRLQNITDTTTPLFGTTEYTVGSSITGQTASVILGVFSITNSKIFEVQHQCQDTRATYGFGTQSGFGGNEIYTVAKFTKIK